MANEAVCIETPTIFERKTVADGGAIPLHTVMQLSSDPNTVTASSGVDIFGGIAWEEKTANDGLTEIVVAMNGIWDLTTAVGITLGGMVRLSGANLIRQAVAGDLLDGSIIGKLHETATGSEVVRVKVGSLV